MAPVTARNDSRNPIRWLHLSDLHMGCRGSEVWWQVRSEFRESVREHFRPIDMILVTGDLTFSAQPKEFKLFDEFLDELLGWLREAGQEADPLVIPVPGNHDLVHLDDLEVAPFYNLERFWNAPEHEFIQTLCKTLWEARKAAYFRPLFGNYARWLAKSILPRLGRRGVSVRRSHFPGDFSVFIDLPDRPPVTVVGLNSAWVQYKKGDFDRRIELFTQQLHCALGDGPGSPLDALAGRLNLLLVHHPPGWFSPSARQRFKEEIYLPDRFLICLHGHMHECHSEAISRSSGGFLYFFQAPSLFGLEHYGTRSETRAIGYAWAEMHADGTVRVWPLKRGPQGGRQVFLWDTEFKPDPDGHRLRPLIDGATAAVATVDIAPWLESLLDRIGYIEISGIGSGIGRTQDATPRYPIEQLYTTLRSRDAAEELAGRSGPVSLAKLISHHPLLLIEGQPGAGKTTFLRLVASMLVRDILRLPCPDALSWREKYLGMEGRAKPLAPLFLRLSELAILLGETEKKAMPDDHHRLLDLLARTASVDGDEERKHWDKHWEGLLTRGEAILLLDGLDEVADDRMRERVFTIFRDACRHWKRVRIIVTTRPFGAQVVREMGFHHAMIQDFGKEEIREFIERWIAALNYLPIGERPEGAAGEKADRIIRDVFRRRALRRLAANPVMLTCLCVVHWNEGTLPEGRARLYRAVIRWLITARSPQREAAGFTDQFAREAFAVLGFAMMGGMNGTKAAVFDFEVGAEAVLTRAERHFPNEAGICRTRDWLRSECLWSGIVEEQAAGKVRFWHLTFQEYLAAQELAWRRDNGGAEDWWPVVRERLDDLQWRETVDLLPGVLFDEGGGGRIDLLLRCVMELRGEAPALATDARVFGIIGRILGPMRTYQYKPPPAIEALYQDLRERILPIFNREGAAKVPVKTRLEAAEALGRGGDPRLDGDTFLEVPGTRGMGLGKYAVTIQEYQVFVDAHGYQECKYWDEDGWRLRCQRLWEDPHGWDEQLEHPNWPVTGVSWYEARAFCRWRSSDSDLEIRLPIEAEWQTAATPDGRTYPWEMEIGDPEPERANFGGNVGSPSPVGVHPAGDGAYGHSDLAGNVWEWMDDPWDRTEDSAVKGTYSSRFLGKRGGSWDSDPGNLRSAISYRTIAETRNKTIGFRVARVSRAM